MNDYALNVLHFWIAILVLWIWICLFWRPYRLDFARENLFALRDELFTLAVEEKLPFDHPAHQGLRNDLNAIDSIRGKNDVVQSADHHRRFRSSN